jgi:hypothetical protein
MNRRTKEGYKLRVYMDAIKEVKSMSNEEWIATQASYQSQGHYISRAMWLTYLEGCALQEADKLLQREAA